MSTLPDRNEIEFAKIEEIANSENDHPVFMLNLNKYFDRSGFLNQDEKYNDYVFDENNGYLYFYDQIKDEFFLKSERYESGYFSEDSIEFYSKLLDNKLIITTIEYGYN